jgi:hypothetical protein
LGNSSKNGNIFTSQKKTIRIQAGTQLRTYWRSLLKQLEILSDPCQYILSLMNLIINKQVIFQTHSFAQCINIRYKHHLHRSYANRSYFQKKYIYVGVKIFNSLSFSMPILKNEKSKFKAALRKYQHTHSLYPVNKFFMYKDDL